MTNHAARLTVASASILVLFLAWAIIAAHPWPARQSAATDPRILALNARAAALRSEAAALERLLAARAGGQAGAGAATVAAGAASAAPPAVKVVTLPPLTITRTS